MRSITFIILGLAAIGTITAAMAITSSPLSLRLEEVPIERLLNNLEVQRKTWMREQPRYADNWYWSAHARLHLLAHLRQTTTLPATARSQVVHEGPFDHCRPIVPQPPAPGAVKPIWKDKCSHTSWDFPARAQRELPNGALGVRHPVDGHLQSARASYEKLRVLAPNFIRPRLALAFVYDRLGARDKAIAELRFVIGVADKRITAAKGNINLQNQGSWGGRGDGYWDDQIVAVEALEHLSLLSKTRGDRKAIKRLRLKLRKIPIVEFMTPILVPLAQERSMGSLINPGANVSFDFMGQGLPLRGDWLTTHAAWLVWDPENNGKITSGFQLFGSVTWLTPWENGYLALATLDDNGDGKIAGGELKGLSLWRDANGDGISDKGEVKPVADWNIVALGYRHKRQSKDAWISEAGVTFANGETRPTYDWLVRTRLVTTAAAKAN